MCLLANAKSVRVIFHRLKDFVRRIALKLLRRHIIGFT
jgi:hypothetical protein